MNKEITFGNPTLSHELNNDLKITDDQLFQSLVIDFFEPLAFFEMYRLNIEIENSIKGIM